MSSGCPDRRAAAEGGRLSWKVEERGEKERGRSYGDTRQPPPHSTETFFSISSSIRRSSESSWEIRSLAGSPELTFGTSDQVAAPGKPQETSVWRCKPGCDRVTLLKDVWLVV
ncbi:hypothetical protein XENOCAPTIV_006610 [Xenoophorus captivus]|uniref:Uncharacterized protein n=1 Tax=Xenoophorus captivus TaxID=1517983 RepID=A0ABV0Q8E4_9TELE